MNHQIIEPTKLIESIHSLVDRFGDELSGARQATRTHLVQYLARQLQIGEGAASELFDALRDAGVIVRGDEPVVEPDIPDKDGQMWVINTHDAEQFVDQYELRKDAPVEHDSQALDLVKRAIAQRATDVHLDPFGDEIEVRFRIDGRLEHYCRLSGSIGEQLIVQLKVLAELDPAEPFHPHEGRLLLPVSLSDVDVRITTTPVVAGEAVALRFLRREQIVRPLETLGFADESLAKVRQMVQLGEGMLLICGPSGVGKTTTAYSLVHFLDDGHRNIVSIEDPVEYLVPGFLQVQVDPKHDLSLAAGVKAAMRMDPDLMLLGEIRDSPTANAAMRAASCGKYVFSTFHARDAAAAITGLRDLHIECRSLASNLRAIIAQRLVRRVCEHCCRSRPITDAEADRFAAEGIAPPQQVPHAVGCDECRGSGYLERIGVFEIGAVTPDLAAAIQRDKNENDLRQLLRSSGVSSLISDGLRKVSQGITTMEEVMMMSCMVAE